jgi:hypothetical protein
VLFVLWKRLRVGDLARPESLRCWIVIESWVGDRRLAFGLCDGKRWIATD